MWFGKKCKICRKRIHKNEETGILRVNTAEGISEMEICMECSDFYDDSAQILNGGARDEE